VISGRNVVIPDKCQALGTTSAITLSCSRAFYFRTIRIRGTAGNSIPREVQNIVVTALNFLTTAE
jgi:hypothetical protein